MPELCHLNTRLIDPRPATANPAVDIHNSQDVYFPPLDTNTITTLI